MRSLKSILSILSILCFVAIIATYAFEWISYGEFPYDWRDKYNFNYFFAILLMCVSATGISLHSMIGKKRASIFFIQACLVSIAYAVLSYVFVGFLFEQPILVGSLALAALIVHIVKFVTKIKYLGYASAALLLASAVVCSIGYESEYIHVLILYYLCVASALFAYAITPEYAYYERINAKENKVEDKPSVKEEKKEEKPKKIEVISRPVVKEKKAKIWTDANGFVYSDRE